MRSPGRLGLALVFACLPGAGHAQTSDGPRLAELLPALILRDITLPAPTSANLSHEAHFSPIEAGELTNPAIGIVQSFNTLMMMQLSTFPLGSSAGGFTYTFDETLGTFRRASGSFGPMFAERAVTIGRGRLSVGATYQRTTYNRFEGQRLDDGSIKFYLRHEECCTPGAGGGGGGGRGGGAGTILTPDGSRLTPSFEGDVIEAALSLEATTNTVAFSTNYGLTSRWDVGFTVPVVRVTLEAGVRATILRLATAAIPQIHTFEVGNPAATERTLRQTGTATGLGDVLLRTKYRLANLAGGGVAAAVDVRLPTGDQANLLGSGTQVKTFLIASTQTGRFAPHLNVGYTAVGGSVAGGPVLSALGGDTHLPNEITYAAGVEFLADPRVTIAADVLGRTLRGAGRLELSSKPFEYQGATAVETVFLDEFSPRTGSLNLMLGTVGVKFNPVGNLLVSGSVLFPLNDAGLRSRLSTVIGVDYAF